MQWRLLMTIMTHRHLEWQPWNLVADQQHPVVSTTFVGEVYMPGGSLMSVDDQQPGGTRVVLVDESDGCEELALINSSIDIVQANSDDVDTVDCAVQTDTNNITIVNIVNREVQVDPDFAAGTPVVQTEHSASSAQDNSGTSNTSAASDGEHSASEHSASGSINFITINEHVVNITNNVNNTEATHVNNIGATHVTNNVNNIEVTIGNVTHGPPPHLPNPLPASRRPAPPHLFGQFPGVFSNGFWALSVASPMASSMCCWVEAKAVLRQYTGGVFADHRVDTEVAEFRAKLVGSRWAWQIALTSTPPSKSTQTPAIAAMLTRFTVQGIPPVVWHHSDAFAHTLHQ